MGVTKRLTIFGAFMLASIFGLSSLASAHVTVKPGEVLTASYQTFIVSVPVEKDIATVAVRVDIPEGLVGGTPTVKPGWDVTVEKEGHGDSHDTVVKSISWTNGSIGAGMRDEFSFSAKTPDEPTTLQWKAYQTYADGSMVSWSLSEDEQPKNQDGSPDFSTSGPLSVTRVSNESPQEVSISGVEELAAKAQRSADRAVLFGVAAVILSLASVFLITRSRGKQK